MINTLIIQSHRSPLPHQWLEPCIASIKHWADFNQYHYQWLGDELFDCLSPELREKTNSQKVIATDLARLKTLQHYLTQGYQTVIWCDADFLIFNPEKFSLPEQENYALGREVWVQQNQNNKLKSYVKVHNAFMFYRQGNSFLDFYTETAEKLLAQTTGPMPPQFIGPKLLTALHNIVQCSVLETAGMLSPLVLQGVLKGEGAALSLFKQKSKQPIAAANLCSSLAEGEGLLDQGMQQVIDNITHVF